MLASHGRQSIDRVHALDVAGHDFRTLPDAEAVNVIASDAVAPRNRITPRRHRFSHLRVRRQARLHIGPTTTIEGRSHDRAGGGRWQRRSDFYEPSLGLGLIREAIVSWITSPQNCPRTSFMGVSAVTGDLEGRRRAGSRFMGGNTRKSRFVRVWTSLEGGR
jgi:hypothetical protein